MKSEVVPDLNETDMKILKELDESGEDGLQPVELAERVDKSKSHVSERVSHLEDLDLIEKEEKGHLNVSVTLSNPEMFQ